MVFAQGDRLKTPLLPITMRKTNATLYISVLCLAAMLAGCTNTGSPPDPTKRLTIAVNVFATAEESLTSLSQQGLIPAADKPHIADLIHVARAAIDDAHTHVNDSQTIFQAAVSQAEASVGPLTDLVSHYQKGGK